LWDDGSVDGDIVSVYLNGNPLPGLNQYTLTGTKTDFTFTVSSGTNNLVLVANNQGTVGPNTCAIEINHSTQHSLSLDLDTGQDVKINF